MRILVDPRRHFSLRITLPILFLLCIVIGLLVTVSITNLNNQVLSKEKSNLSSLVDSFNFQTILQSENALGLATTVVQNAEVKRMFSEKDREGLNQYLNPVYETLKTDFNVEQAQFHTPPGISFLRLNKPEKFGDDLTTIRPMVTAVNKEKKALSGFEFGVTGFGIRGVTPVTLDGEYLGSFEIGISFNDELLNKFKASSSAEYTILTPDTENAGEFKILASTLLDSLSVEKSIQSVVFQTGEETVSFIKSADGTPYSVITAPVKDFSGNIICLMQIALPRAETLKAMDSNYQTMVLMGITFLVVTGAFMAGLIKYLTRPIKSMQKLAGQIAREDLPALIKTSEQIASGDLTAKMTISDRRTQVKSLDEIGVLQQSFNSIIESLLITTEHFDDMTDKLRNLVGRVAIESENVAVASRTLIDVTDESDLANTQMESNITSLVDNLKCQNDSIIDTAASVGQMTQAVSDVAHGAEDQSGAINQATNATAQMLYLIGEITEKAKSGDDLSMNAGNTARKGAESVSASLQAMDRIASQVSSSAEKVKVMGERSNQIGMIVETIEEIASQTNLLALNAAIEAARAGEAGKGFAVVADEVKKLAEKSTDSTKKISDLVKDIRNSADEAVIAMDLSRHEVQQGVDRSNESAAALESILAAVNQVIGQVKEISLSAKSMNQAAGTVNEAMESVSAVVEENTAVTVEMASDADKVSASMEEAARLSQNTMANISQISDITAHLREHSNSVILSAQKLSNLSQVLESDIARFKLD